MKLLTNLYLFSYEYDIILDLKQQNNLHLARKFNPSLRCIDDLLSVGILPLPLELSKPKN